MLTSKIPTREVDKAEVNRWAKPSDARNHRTLLYANRRVQFVAAGVQLLLSGAGQNVPKSKRTRILSQNVPNYKSKRTQPLVKTYPHFWSKRTHSLVKTYPLKK